MKQYTFYQNIMWSEVERDTLCSLCISAQCSTTHGSFFFFWSCVNILFMVLSGLGHTVPELEVQKYGLTPIAKTQFSMCVPEVNDILKAHDNVSTVCELDFQAIFTFQICVKLVLGAILYWGPIL